MKIIIITVLPYYKDTDILSDFQIYMTFCQYSDILSVHIICEIYLTQIKIKNKRFLSATRIFTRYLTFQKLKHRLYFYLTQINFVLGPHQSSLLKTYFIQKNKTKMCRLPLRASETNSKQNRICSISLSY